MITKRIVRNISGSTIFIGHLACISIIIYKWNSIDSLVDLGAPLLPVTAYAFTSVIRFSSSNKMYADDNNQALFLFILTSIGLPIFVVTGNIIVILAVDTNLLGPNFGIDQGREMITWLETALGAGYATIVEGLFSIREEEGVNTLEKKTNNHKKK